MELARKGVPKEIVSEMITTHFDDDTELSLVHEAALKKMKSLGNYPRDKQYKRMMNFLIARGFSLDKARSATSDILDKSVNL
jgi:SOS response regulatory protein OraA/RecX